MVYSGPVYSGPPYGGAEAPETPPGAPVEPGPVFLGLVYPGAGPGTLTTDPSRALLPGPILLKVGVGAPQRWPEPNSQPALKPGPIRLKLGYVIPPVIPPPDPIVPDPPDPLDLWVTKRADAPLVTVSGITGGRVLAASCSPQINGPGSASVTWEGGAVSVGTKVTITVGGANYFYGLVQSATQVQVSQGEERDQVWTLSLVGAVVELEGSVVLPDSALQDFTNQDLDRQFRSPVNDSRQFDWRQPGIFTGDGGAPITQDMVDKVLGKLGGKRLELPDPWIDQDSMWMLSGAAGAGAGGWRVFSGKTLKVPVRWDGGLTDVTVACVVAEGKAEVYVDGVQVLTVASPLQPEITNVEMTPGYHDVDIRAVGGQVAFSMRVPGLVGGLFGRSLLRSGGDGGFRLIPAPDRLKRNLAEVWGDVVAPAGGPVRSWSVSMPSLVPSEPLVLEVGMTTMDVLNRFAEDYIDWIPSGGGPSVTCVPKGQGSGGSAGSWVNPLHVETNIVRK